MDESFGEADFETYVENIDDTLLLPLPTYLKITITASWRRIRSWALRRTAHLPFVCSNMAAIGPPSSASLGMLDALIHSRRARHTGSNRGPSCISNLAWRQQSTVSWTFMKSMSLTALLYRNGESRVCLRRGRSDCARGKLTHTAVVNAARALYQREPSLVPQRPRKRLGELGR